MTSLGNLGAPGAPTSAWRDAPIRYAHTDEHLERLTALARTRWEERAEARPFDELGASYRAFLMWQERVLETNLNLVLDWTRGGV